MRNLLLLFFLGVILAGCSSVQVSYDYDQQADFSSIRSYAWRGVDVPGDVLSQNPLAGKRIRQSIDRHLADRGYQLVDDKPDVLVAIHAVTKEKMRVTNWGGYYRDPWYDPWWGPGPYGGRMDVQYYTEGTLVIDIVDAASNELIWRGLGMSLVRKYKNQEQMQEAIDRCVTEILDRFPPEQAPGTIR
jgi:hypothetical protein